MRRQDGFTLAEAMTALFVFAVAAAAALALNTETARAMTGMETSVYARIIADNEMALTLGAKAAPDRGQSSGEEELAGRRWDWARLVSATPDPDVDRIDMTVRIKGEARVAASLTAFRGRT
jgi:general secretion pathway protein I